MTRKEYNLGLIGWPLTHSLSPEIHQAALKHLGLAGNYRCFPVEPLPNGGETLDKVLDQMRAGELRGLNVTVPHKENVIDKLDRTTTAAGRIGAVNTLFKEGAELVGDNTDMDGFLLDLATTLGPEKGSALVMGAGGAARAVVAGLNGNGWNVWVAARRMPQAESLVETLTLPGKPTIAPVLLAPGVVREIELEITLIVNTTPVGMSPEVDASPWPGEIPFPERACVYDLVYTPRHTQLIRDAQAAGLKATTGMGMLVEQAALAFERWTGLSAPRDVMQIAGKQAVDELKEGEGS